MKLVICEKNIAARRISTILSDGKSKQGRIGPIPIYEFNRNNEPWTVIGLKGHIINTDYPTSYNVWWHIAPKKLINIPPEKKVSEKKIAAALKSLVDTNPFIIVATDFDREGELIGVEVVDYLQKYNKNITEVKRAKFSAITKYEITEAFSKLSDVDYSLSAAGESRQLIDLIWGVVLTRFISLTANKTGKDYLSIGRVQSPTLALLVAKEKEIQAFKPEPFWRLLAKLKKDILFEAEHKNGRFWKKEEIDSIFAKVSNAKEALVTDIKKTENKEKPPAPFSTTTFLQASSYLKLSAPQAMKIAEELYMGGLISYPRTDNTVYPASLGIKNILTKLKQSSFKDEVNEVLTNGRKYPTRGPKQTTDHPPIHPVGVPKNDLTGSKKKVYELIVRRFLATLAKDAVSESIDVAFSINDEVFKSKGYRLIEANWKGIYYYFSNKDKPLPSLEKKEVIPISNITVKEDETKPPKRYSQGSLIATMESLALGTKSTRHEIINKLYQRKYINLSPLAPTPLAMAVIDSMNDCDVVKPKMTAVLEDDMNLIADGKKTLAETVDESRKMLTKVMEELEQNKSTIKENIRIAHRKQNTIGVCPECGKSLVIRRSKKGKRFVGCEGYPTCKNTYALPQNGMIKPLEKSCKYCNSPMVNIISKGKKPWEICININCTSSKLNNNSNNKKNEKKD
jgi:DNA topoisomerase I